MEEIIITTTDFVPGFEIERIIGVCFRKYSQSEAHRQRHLSTFQEHCWR
ncbi:MAG: hypothetical protein QXM23_05725 [Archaeoglobaceae archaeon]